MIAWLGVLDALATRDYVALLDDSGVVPADSLTLRRTAPSDYADTQTWVRYALAMDSTGAWRLRHTDIDNAPTGREVHWSSAFTHVVAAAGKLRRVSTGEPIAAATERSLAWVNLPLLLLVVITFSTLVARRAGVAAGALLAFGMVGHPQFYGGFAPNNVDHHGLLSAASLGVVLGIVFMGLGWSRPRGDALSLIPETRPAARAGALISAVSGAFGMWISSASVIPTIAFAGAAGLLATWWLGEDARRDGAAFDAQLWRLWGRIGGSLSLFFYFVEYAPHDIALRLEVNHPLYALAWFGGGELIALLLERRVARVRAPAWKILLSLATILAAPMTIVFAGSRAFAPLDGGIARIHESISEFRSMVSLLRSHDRNALSHYVLAAILVLPALVVSRRAQKDRLLIAFTAVCVVAGAALALWQIRWWLSASGPELCLLLVVVMSIGATRGERARWIIVAAISAIFVEQAVARIRLTRANVASSAVTIADAAQPLYRDVAASLRVTQPAGDIVLLASPTASSGISYFGGFKSLGTLYWENAEGLRAAAAIFSARTDDVARTLIKARGVTHVAMMGQGEFLEQYLALARPSVPRGEITHTFGYRLLQDDSLPRWLRRVAIPIRPGAVPAALAVRAMQVVPDQSEPEALWSLAQSQLAAHDTAAAELNFRSAIALFPTARRPTLYEVAARAAFRASAQAVALRLLREAMTLAPTRTTQTSVAWLLATSTDDGVRDGARALTLIEPLVKQSPNDPALLDVLAAAFAETGNFAEAVTVASRVVEIQRANTDVAAEAEARERLESYRNGRPWRVR